MLDGQLKRRMDPLLVATARRLAAMGVTANGVTYAAFAVGLAAAAAIASGHTLWGLGLLLLSRLGDGLDGAVARQSGPSDFGGLIDIVLDFAFYGIIPLAFILLDPVANGIAGGLLLLSFYVNGASFLAYAIIAEKRGETTQQRGAKSIHFTTGLAEATETYLAFAVFCLWPAGFAITATIFAVICFYTAASRLVLARRAFGPDRSDG
ncbi:CDP-alcohol phosphatidyltransferase family protein [Pseudohoeflea suaedae]|uniref:CDP-alcohol phosphatidyltransferase family protein n=1 Tax=Pseudohoeflea suaedae TaxID=877384 RepID=A0A4R5PMP0_9HYPH|nr:CDP-alcohol phosphatidyltransferase family protein [Pseudohoeflea suaedae]TDH38179.1 CDP-alcohol phosphatidyltransferase family protein [Pseudohoeflea suaedae]